MALVPIRTAKPEERRSVLATAVLAFGSDPLMRWIFDDPGDYLEYFGPLVDAFGGRGFDGGSVYATEHLEGVALWLPPGTGPDGEAVEELVTAAVRPSILEELAEVFGQMEGHHPKEPHWYLPVIGVEPYHHGRGLGGALLSHALAIADGDDYLAYLESSNPRNISLYQRQGFEAIAILLHDFG